jgi:hypothetical protein
MAGPLANVGTITSGINLDVNRSLYWGRNLIMEFFVPDVNEVTGLRLVQTLTKGFNRITGDEVTKGDGKTVIFQVALVKANEGFQDTIRLKDLQVRVDGETYVVGEVPDVAPNEAQVYTLYCKTRTLRSKPFTN